MTIGEEIAWKVRRHIWARGISENAWLKQHGMNRSTICNLLQTSKGPTAETIVKLCRGMGCTAGWLLGLETKNGRPRDGEPGDGQRKKQCTSIIAERKGKVKP